MNAQHTIESYSLMDQKQFLFETYLMVSYQTAIMLQHEFSPYNVENLLDADLAFETKAALARILREHKLIDEYNDWKTNHENGANAARRTKDYSKKK